jgi:integrase/recombinase XerC
MSNPLTVRELIALYVRHSQAEGVHGPAARADREYTFGVFCQQCGDMPVVDCKPYHLTDFIESHPEWKSVSTRRAKANGIRAAFNWALRQERILRNPFANVQYAEHERREAMPDDALDEIGRVASKQYEAMLRFLRQTGCRTGELCAATWADVDLDRGIWTINRHKSRRFTGRPKVVALVDEAVSLLRSMRGDEGPIFLNTRGRPWTPGVLAKQLRRLKQRHGITVNASLHGVRHRFACAAVANGAPLKLVSAQLGHATSAITERYYVDLSGEMDAIRDAARLAMPKTVSA